ncbi:tetratricopeptide repeat protein [Gramella sp. MAR_2010_147]|uniref:tetratricopeptide repeat protein n=1 Tax=Gramella sp. MAR_2010_147 TaxID=1250205 RepID=UPI00087CF834|nr:tetratricopeptide repeat protein [Gramella sp. MAR_2010_147]SDS55080.1 Tetratricopeptide repeat-containing protein [Gramella sp. MAR_2010_147]
MLANFRLIVGLFHLFTFGSMAQTGVESAEKFLNNGEIEKARTIFLQNKEMPKSIEYLGDIASFNKNWDEAIEYYETLIDMDPENAKYNFKLGGAMGMKAYYGSKFQAALLLGDIKEYLKKAAAMDPTHKESRRALVELYVQIPSVLGGSKTIAESYASDLDRLNEVDALLADAYIYKNQEYKDLARNKYNEAIRVALKKPDLLTRNYLKYELGEAAAIYEIQLDGGEKFLREYIANYGYKDLKSPAWAYLRLAQIERARNNQQAALNLIEKSLEIDPDFDKALVEKQKIQRL